MNTKVKITGSCFTPSPLTPDSSPARNVVTSHPRVSNVRRVDTSGDRRHAPLCLTCPEFRTGEGAAKTYPCSRSMATCSGRIQSRKMIMVRILKSTTTAHNVADMLRIFTLEFTPSMQSAAQSAAKLWQLSSSLPVQFLAFTIRTTLVHMPHFPSKISYLSWGLWS